MDSFFHQESTIILGHFRQFSGHFGEYMMNDDHICHIFGAFLGGKKREEFPVSSRVYGRIMIMGHFWENL